MTFSSAITKKAKKKQAKGEELPSKQGEYEVGNKKPPKEHQFKPGQSGNPKGPPKRRVQLWTYICQYIALTDAQLEKLHEKQLTLAQQWALRIVKNTKTAKVLHLDRFARYVIDRDEGRATEHLVFEDENVLTEEECEEIREVLRRNLK